MAGASCSRAPPTSSRSSRSPAAKLALEAAIARLDKYHLLILDDLAYVTKDQGNPALFTAETVIVAQAVMIVTSLIAMRVAAGKGYWLVMLILFAALPVRGLIAGSVIQHWGVWPVQALDGIGAGLQSVAVPARSCSRCATSARNAAISSSGRRNPLLFQAA